MDSLRNVYRTSVGTADARKRTMRELKNRVYNYTEMEQMVREATCNNAADPQTELMREIAKGTFTVDFSAIMTLVWKRLKDRSNEHHPSKCLILLEFLMREGNGEMVATQVQNNLHLIRALTSWHFYNENHFDIAAPVREAAEKFLQVARLLAPLQPSLPFPPRLRTGPGSPPPVPRMSPITPEKRWHTARSPTRPSAFSRRSTRQATAGQTGVIRTARW